MKRIFNGNARALAMDMPDVHHIAIYGDLIAAKVQGRAVSIGRLRLVSTSFNDIGEIN